MFSLSKLLFLALVIGAVWFGWRWFNRVGAVGRERLREREQRAGGGPFGAGAGANPRAPRSTNGDSMTEDMEKCPECGAYVAPRSAVSCGRPGCPYGR
ncbi:hypothetical protein [Azospirillum rugosum]|uniref:Zinc ribbon domain-containing protein n=1 Tax=Azospirillum rugosum TaxID=416170 RepID=A0ABS4SSS5_9PROT|nr:hypothetical protein [Azospirillum rugosum]MBP2295294.1 uncharacterized protein [Azospirillum rugosum]MDQ0528669.1 uncharacterized protein [Azospirillum rugosum]